MPSKPVCLEMSSINPVVILPGALRERRDEIAGQFCTSCLMAAGQFCTNPGVVVALAGAGFDQLARRLGELVADAPAGYMLHAGIATAYAAGVARDRQ